MNHCRNFFGGGGGGGGEAEASFSVSEKYTEGVDFESHLLDW